MDYTELANGFATIVGLLSSFISHRKGDNNGHEEFFEWLKEHHEALSNKILANNKITDEIRSMLNQDRDFLLKKFSELDNRIATTACSFTITRGLAKAMKPGAELSDQAVSILEQLVDSGGSWLLEIRSKDGVKLIIYDGDGNIDIKEPRFLDDDLRSLVNAELLLHGLNDAGDSKYTLTRAGYGYIEDYRTL